MRIALGSCLLALLLGACKREAPPPPPTPAAPKPTLDLTAPAGAETSASGLRSQVLEPGTGKEHPEPQDLVEVHYTGWKSDGTQFDSSRERNAPAQFTVDGAIKGWSEGVQRMVVGEKRRLWVPPALAYGDKPPTDRAPAGALVFDLELLKILKRPAPLPAPADLGAPPAQKTRSGLAYRVLAKGTGKQHPKATSLVELHYTGWGPDGKMVDSSVVRGQVAKMQLQAAGPGWTEALRLMVAGEKARFWIPASLTTAMGAPAPNSVYDVELLAIH
jgi:FKBP-type peptidyl-prolyl cis-trans isomerase